MPKVRKSVGWQNTSCTGISKLISFWIWLACFVEERHHDAEVGPTWYEVEIKQYRKHPVQSIPDAAFGNERPAAPRFVRDEIIDSICIHVLVDN